jgi:hypothetical protein
MKYNDYKYLSKLHKIYEIFMRVISMYMSSDNHLYISFRYPLYLIL